MKVKRYKHARKLLSFYKRTFGMHEPYQILVDGTFCQAALQGRVNIKEQLPKYFSGTVQLVTTKCVLTELDSLGDKLKGAFFIAKRFQLRNCSHAKKTTKPATECLLSLIGEDNPHHYFIASQDPELKNKLRKIPGVPLLHIIRNTVVLEGASDASSQKAEELSASKVNPKPHEKSVIDSLNAPKKKLPAHKKKRGKGANPLSIRKSQKVAMGDRDIPAAVVSRSKKRRVRLQRRKAIEVLAQVIQSTGDEHVVMRTSDITAS